MKKHPPQRAVRPEDLTFMASLSQAVLEKPARTSRWLVWIILLVVVWLVVWADMAELDKIVRGEGTVVPSGRVQVVQNLEGGIVESIKATSGDKVQQDQILVELDNTQFLSNFGEQKMELMALRAKSERLEAQAGIDTFDMPASTTDTERTIYQREQALYLDRLAEVETAVRILREQIIQHKTELDNAFEQKAQLQQSHRLLLKEIEMTRPLVRQGIASKVEMLRVQREANDTFGKLNSVRQSIPRYRSLIEETQQKIQEIRQKAQNDAKESLNEVMASISQLESTSKALEDKVLRTRVRAPEAGVISEMLVNTVGEVVQPGSDIAKIVPKKDYLVVETRIAPADIGFVRPGMKARMRFTAYDFSVYGGLEGQVQKVSADTITDEEGNSFYLAKIWTAKNHLGPESDPLELMAGMVVSVDVVVGKHTVLDYILKPILKTREVALRES